MATVTDTHSASLPRYAIDRRGPRILDAEKVGNMTAVFFCARGAFYVAGTTKPQTNILRADPWTWVGIKDSPPCRLDLVNLYPQYLVTMTKITAGLLDPNMYIKRPNYLRSARWLGCLSGIVDGNTIAKLSMREIRVCELLKDNPHPNVAVYYGVCTDTAVSWKDCGTIQRFKSERVVGLCFKKYDGTLQDVVDRDQTFDAEKAMADIEIGVAHLHKLGLVHCDLKPANIFHENGSFVIGDFDSCHKIGDPYRLKAGSRGWCVDKRIATVADSQHDHFSLGRIRLWLKEKGSGKPISEKAYPSTDTILQCNVRNFVY